ncbi:hypothetical protein SteCoe_17446 [Stentor coeruleus]|uniref:GAR domain-containing protein n=1 Tax=Stentor coeruleus TaxID=5963 RepID=A0A1R2BYT8_9CILI|nr:hypothetical protein SteCoe_17446 [Stentor coeruleus]
MEDFLLVQISIKNCWIGDPSKPSLEKTRIQIMSCGRVEAYFPPYDSIFITLIKSHNLEVHFFQDQKQLCLQKVDIENLTSEPKSYSLNFEIQGIKGHLGLSAVLFDSNLPSNNSVISKFKDSINDVERIKELLIENWENIKIPIGTGQELGVDLEMVQCTEKITRQEAENLKNTVIGLNEKLKVLQLVEKILKEEDKNLYRHLQAREEMQNQLLDKCEELKDFALDRDRKLLQSYEKVTGMQKELLTSESKNRDLESIINDLNGQIKILQGEKNQLKAQVKNFDSMEAFIRNLQKNIKTLEENREKMRNDFKKHEEEHEKLNIKKTQEFQDVIDKNLKLEEIIKEKDKKIMELESIIESKNTEILELQGQCRSYLGEIQGLKDQETKAISFEALAKKHQLECIKTQENMQKTTSKFSEVVKNINSEKVRYLKLSLELQGQIKSLELKITSLEQNLNNEYTRTMDLTTKVTTLSSSTTLSIDSQHISKSLLKLYSEYSKTKMIIAGDFLIFYKSFMLLATNLKSLNKLIVHIREIYLAKDEEIHALYDVIAELQKRIPYTAAKDDPVDSAMAEYINSLESPLDIPFVREEPGIYLFGSKRIFIKLDNGKLSIRIGGGTVLMDEYVQMHTDIEMARLEERRKRKSSPQRQMMGKIIEKITGDKVKDPRITAQKVVKCIMDANGKNKIITIPRSHSRGGDGSRSPMKINRLA